MNQEAWLNLVRTGIQNEGLFIETPAGEINPPTGYDPNWLAWATKYKPKKEDTGPGPGPDIINPIVDPITDPDPTNSQTKSTQTDLTQAGVAAKAIEEFMKAQGHTWDKLRSCTITSTTAEFADQVASLIQGSGEGISIFADGRQPRHQLGTTRHEPADLQEILKFSQKDAATGGRQDRGRHHKGRRQRSRRHFGKAQQQPHRPDKHRL